MQDLEFVLRFFALEKATLGGERFKDHMSIFMKERNAQYAEKPSLQGEDEYKFRTAVSNAILVFGDSAFRRGPDNSGHRSVPFADAVMHALSGYERKQLDGVISDIKLAFAGLLKDSEFMAAISKGTNGEKAIHTRVTKAREAVITIAGFPKKKQKKSAGG